MPMGGLELLVILAILLLFFGARRLPELGRSLGKTKQEFSKAAVEDSDDAEQLREAKENEEQPLREEAHATEPDEASLREEESSSRAEAATTHSANGRGA